MHRRDWHRQLVDARLRQGRRPEPDREPVRRLRLSRDTREPPVHGSVAPTAGMVTPAVVKAFRSIGWGWGGAWSGSTKDYMHFSVTGH